MRPKTVNRRLMAALDQDNTLVITPEDLATAKGFTTEYMQFLGLRKSDLKFLEVHGMAKRGYVRVPVGNIFKGTKTQVRWILIGDLNESHLSKEKDNG